MLNEKGSRLEKGTIHNTLVFSSKEAAIETETLMCVN